MNPKQPEIDFQRMRLCFYVAAIWHEWPPAHQAELSAEIKKAIDTHDKQLQGWWANYLETASGLSRLEKSCRAMEQRIRAEAREKAS